MLDLETVALVLAVPIVETQPTAFLRKQTRAIMALEQLGVPHITPVSVAGAGHSGWSIRLAPVFRLAIWRCCRAFPPEIPRRNAP
jgi:hypothetical protein